MILIAREYCNLTLLTIVVIMLSLRLGLVRSLRSGGLRCIASTKKSDSGKARSGPHSLRSRIVSILDEVKEATKEKKRTVLPARRSGNPMDKLYERVGKLADSSERSPEQEQLQQQKQLPLQQQQVVSTPEKVMIFVDGTWLFYNIFKTNTLENSLVKKFGKNWVQEYTVDWSAIPRLVSAHVAQQLEMHSGYHRPVDVRRTVMYTAATADTQDHDARKVMMLECMECNFDVTCFVTRGSSEEERSGIKIKEKCVDIGLAVDMLYMAFAGGAVDAYDTAVLLTGDKDFIPAMEKTRLVGKKVVLCSVRNSCSKDLSRREVGVTKIRDFDVLWLDDHLDTLLVKRNNLQVTKSVIKAVERIIDAEGEADPEAENDAHRYMSFRELGRRLSKEMFEDKQTSVLETIKRVHRSMYRFFEANTDKFVVRYKEELYPDFMICINDGSMSSDSRYTPPGSPDEADAHDEEDAGEDDESAFFGTEDSSDKSSGALDVMTKTDLCHRCKELGLKTSGTKAELVSRLMQHVPKAKAVRVRAKKEKKAPLSPPAARYAARDVNLFDIDLQGAAPANEEDIAALLRRSLEGYLAIRTGRRDTGRQLGRYLKSLVFEDGSDALQLCKEHFGSVSSFVAARVPTIKNSQLSRADVLLADEGFDLRDMKEGEKVILFTLVE